MATLSARGPARSLLGLASRSRRKRQYPIWSGPERLNSTPGSCNLMVSHNISPGQALSTVHALPCTLRYGTTPALQSTDKGGRVISPEPKISPRTRLTPPADQSLSLPITQNCIEYDENLPCMSPKSQLAAGLPALYVQILPPRNASRPSGTPSAGRSRPAPHLRDAQRSPGAG